MPRRFSIFISLLFVIVAMIVAPRSALAVCSLDTYESNDSIASARSITSGTTVTGLSICSVADQDYFTFTLTTWSSVLIETSGGTTVDDTYMVLYDSAGGTIEYDDDDGTNLFSLINRTSMTPGTYYVLVREYNNVNTINSYNLALTATPIADPYEDDDNSSQARTITNGTLESHSIVAAGDEDWFKITLTDYMDLSITTDGIASGDTVVYLYSSSLGLVTYDDDSGTDQYSYLRQAGLAPGTYYIRVNAYSASSTIAYYNVGFTTAVSDAYEDDDSSTQARLLSSGSAQIHDINPTSDVDWTYFTLSTWANVTIETSGTSGDTELYLYDSNLAQVAYNDDIVANTNLWSRVTMSLAAGTYYVRVSEYGANSVITDYSLALSVNCTDPYEDDDLAASAGAITSGVPQTHSICTTGDEDWVTFTTTDLTNARIEASVSGLTIELYDSALTLTTTTSCSTASTSCIGVQGLPDGTWYARVTDLTGRTISAYDLTYTSSCTDAWEDDDLSTQASLLVPGVSQVHGICPLGDADWYTFTLTSANNVTIETYGPSTDDTNLYLYNAALTEVTHDDDSGVGAFSRISVSSLPAGTYYVRCAEAGNNATIDEYSITLGLCSLVTSYADTDGDGYGDPTAALSACSIPTGNVSNSGDCNDRNAAVRPGVSETCNSVDDDCDGSVDEDAIDRATWYRDADGDGYGIATNSTLACTQPVGFAATSTDCNDNVSTVHPGVAETCNTVDDDCDGSVDEDAIDRAIWYQDSDGDGFGNVSVTQEACTIPVGFVSDHTDCNDSLGTVHPGASEICDNVDQDCSGTVDDNATNAPPWYVDGDQDGWGGSQSQVISCTQPIGLLASDGDCDDTNADVHPGATEHCGSPDEDCDGSDDAGAIDATTWYRDLDNDGFGDDASTEMACTVPQGFTSVGGDCDDIDNDVFPGALEVCNGDDDDCDPATDERVDSDGDAITVCAGDCNDLDPAIFPGQFEVCNEVDDDCDPTTDEALDGDGDGYAICGGDCDDDDPTVSPAAKEACNGIDDDCDGVIPRLEADVDGDGHFACDDDCDDDNDTTWEGAPELCDGVDNDCDEVVDEDVDLDEDADGFNACQGDCDDGNPDVYPSAEEICDGLDDNCDGRVPADESDEDGDDFLVCEDDCDDAEPTMYPGASEECDGVDNDCDGILPDDEADADGDGWKGCDGDCDDTLDDVYPDAVETCDDGIDQDCDGTVDEDCGSDDTSAPTDTGEGKDEAPNCGCATGGGSLPAGALLLVLAGWITRRRRVA